MIKKQIKYIQFVIWEKLNHTVPVLLDRDMYNSLNHIISERGRAGVNKKIIVFGISGWDVKSFKNLRACQLLKKFSKECGAKNPQRLRGTYLRKHIATPCISLNLQEQDVSDLANFMGPAEKFHKIIYRQLILNREILMSKLLEAAQGADHQSEHSDESGAKDDENKLKCRPSTATKGSVKRRSSMYLCTHFEIIFFSNYKFKINAQRKIVLILL